ncbi:MAG: DUF5667 domain-containing protein [Euzebya sp.]
MDHIDHADRNPAIAELLEDAYIGGVGLDTAARHLWVIHSEADRLKELAGPGTEAELVTTTAESDAPIRRSIPRAAVPILALVMMMSSSGVALAASQGSLPGDVLYPVKRGTETAQLIFTRSPQARAQLQLAFARNRLDEIRRIGDTRPEHVPALVADITISLEEVEREAPEVASASQRIRQETGEQIAQLRLPGPITQAVGDALSAAPSAQTTTPAPVAGESQTSTTSAVASTETPTTTETEIAGTRPGSDNAGPAVGEDATGASAPGPTVTVSDAPSEADTTTATTTPAAPSAGPSAGATPAPSGSSTPSANPSPSASANDDGPVVTPRPHPTEGGGQEGEGTSRSDDDPTGAAASGHFVRPADSPTDEPAADQS